MCSSAWKIHYKSGDLFRCPATDALAHCISEDCRMGAGIAVSFRKRFGGVQELLSQKKRPGQCAVLKRPERFVYYLITKEKYNYKPEYITLKRSLLDMRNHCLENDVRSVSMPRIGCGLDKLNWSEVSLIITDVFKHTDVRITVYDLERRRVDAKGTTRQNRELLGKVGSYSQKAAP